MKAEPPQGTPTAAQLEAVELLREVAASTNGVAVVGEPCMSDRGYQCVVEIGTTVFEQGDAGLKVNTQEQVTLLFTERYPAAPPEASVDHLRWLGFPHVLQAQRLCLYLDPDREWDPSGGAAAALHRLWEWFADAIAGRFDPRTSLHHGFGGVTSASSSNGNPVLFVCEAPHDLRPGIRSITAVARSSSRIDLISWSPREIPDQIAGLALVSAQPFRVGLPTTLRGIIGAIDQPLYAGWSYPAVGFPTADLLTFRLERLASQLDPDDPVVLLFAAPNLAVSGPGRFDLMAARTTASGVTRALSGKDTQDKEGLEFLRVDDARPEVTTRRDDARPTTWFTGRTVELWGCGALGSWISELLVRAGVRRVRLRDHTKVMSGLLVRQNYIDADIGNTKAESLARRLRDICPDVEIEAHGSAYEVLTDGLKGGCDLLIDATVSGSVARLLDHVSLGAAPSLLISQVATDSASATLGLVTCVHGGASPSELDAVVRDAVLEDPQLEAFRCMWDGNDELLTPARGGSIPTFRGSAADVMGISSSLISLLGGLCRARQTGAQLIRLPHSPLSAPDRTWVPGPSV